MITFPRYRVFDNVHGENNVRFWYSDNMPEGTSYVDFWQWISQHPDLSANNLQQCSEVLDQDDIVIYEGDILQWWYNTEEDGPPGLGGGGCVKIDTPVVAIFRNGQFGFEYFNKFHTLFGERLIVIGNIHENPELLKK